MTLEERVERIEERNRLVEGDKVWETSWTRRIILVVFTYAVITLFIWLIGVPNPELSGLVPAAGYLISTLTMPYIKRWWLNKRDHASR